MVLVREDMKRKKNPRLKYRRTSPGLVRKRVPTIGEMKVSCNEKKPCPRLVLLYAKMGLHRYNLLEGKSLQFHSVTKYKQSTACAASSYSITLEAFCGRALQTFETKVSERSYGRLVLSCRLGRPLGETEDESKRSFLKRCLFLVKTMPHWPLENPFENSEMNQSDLEDNDAWIRLYLELAVGTTNRHTLQDHDLSNLEIVKVAKDSTPQDVDVEFNRKNVAIMYIMYKDSCEARVGKNVDRVAIIRRAYLEQHGCFSLVGRTMSLERFMRKQTEKLSLSLCLKQRLVAQGIINH